MSACGLRHGDKWSGRDFRRAGSSEICDAAIGRLETKYTKMGFECASANHVVANAVFEADNTSNSTQLWQGMVDKFQLVSARPAESTKSQHSIVNPLFLPFPVSSICIL